MPPTKPVSHLVLILFTCSLGANVIGEALRVLLHFVAGEGTVVERALLQYVEWGNAVGPLNLIILSLSVELGLRFNLLTIVGLAVGWYYYKYNY